jgi:hypothetical protein
MAMSEQNDRNERPWQRMIQERQEHLESILDALTEHSAHVDLSPSMKRDVAVATLNLHRVLAKYKEEDEDGGSDELPDVSEIRKRMGKTTGVLKESVGLGRGMTQSQVPAVDELDFEYLEEIANKTEKAAKELGFWAKADSTTHRTEIDDELMEEVEKWQNNNLDN